MCLYNRLMHYRNLFGIKSYPLLFVLWLIPSAVQGETSFFDEAQVAASEGRYEDVVNVLTEALTNETLGKEDLVVAHSNRGIAHSLLKQYGAAIKDLSYAIELDPLHLLSLNHLGILAEHVERDYLKAAGWYRRAATAGYAASQVNLGNLYRLGRGVNRDTVKAAELFNEAVAQNYATAHVSLGELYLDAGEYDRGIDHLERAVDKGVVTGHYYLGIAFENGLGVLRDYSQASEHYRLSAEQGHAESQSALGYLYRRGYGVEKSFVEAAKWYTFAADQGDVVAANRLAWLLATCPIREVCNGRTAIQYASFAVESEPSASNLDSLAAAHARVGEFDRAIAVIERIAGDESLDDATRSRYTGRLELYQHGIPFQL